MSINSVNGLNTRTIDTNANMLTRRMYHFGSDRMERLVKEAGIIAEVAPVHENPMSDGAFATRIGVAFNHWSVKLIHQPSGRSMHVFVSLGSGFSYSMPYDDGEKRPQFPTAAACIEVIFSDILSCEPHLGAWDPARGFAEELDIPVDQGRRTWDYISGLHKDLRKMLGWELYERLRRAAIDEQGNDYVVDPYFAPQAQQALHDLLVEFLGDPTGYDVLADAGNLRELLVDNVLRGDFFEQLGLDFEPKDKNPVSYRALGNRVARATMLLDDESGVSAKAYKAIMALDDEFTSDGADAFGIDARIERIRTRLEATRDSASASVVVKGYEALCKLDEMYGEDAAFPSDLSTDARYHRLETRIKNLAHLARKLVDNKLDAEDIDEFVKIRDTGVGYHALIALRTLVRDYAKDGLGIYNPEITDSIEQVKDQAARLRHVLTQGKVDREKVERLHSFLDDL